MKYTITVYETREEEVLIFVHKKTELVNKIETMLKETNSQLVGFKGSEIIVLNEDDIYCFIVENNKVYGLTKKEKYLLKQRLYQLEQMLGDDFIKINQSSIANFKRIEKFDASIGGSLKVVFKNGYIDYVSRRNIKKVKERLGI